MAMLYNHFNENNVTHQHRKQFHHMSSIPFKIGLYNYYWLGMIERILSLCWEIPWEFVGKGHWQWLISMDGKCSSEDNTHTPHLPIYNLSVFCVYPEVIVELIQLQFRDPWNIQANECFFFVHQYSELAHSVGHYRYEYAIYHSHVRPRPRQWCNLNE